MIWKRSHSEVGGCRLFDKSRDSPLSLQRIGCLYQSPAIFWPPIQMTGSYSMQNRFKWILQPTTAVPEETRSLTGGHWLIPERLHRAGLTTESEIRAFLDPDFYPQSDPYDLPDLDIGVSLVASSLRRGGRILIWGDSDLDGLTATALLYTALREAGGVVRYHVPRRDGVGRGSGDDQLREWMKQGIALIISGDTGISSAEALAVAKSARVDIVVIGHQLPQNTWPEATAVISPLRLPSGHRMRELPVVGVAFELMRALRAGSGSSALLDLAAIGIVGDGATLLNETRYLLQRGLESIRHTARPGLQSLIGTAGLSPHDLDESDLHFSLGPRLSAQGRLGDPGDAVELLSTADPARAAELASQIEGMNARRRLESRLVEESAHDLLEKDPSVLEYAAIVLAHPEWGGGTVGIVASRLAELHQRPVILLGESGGLLVGAARSVAGCNITEALRDCSDQLVRYGGHAMAAGVALRADKLSDFRRRFSGAVRERLPVDGGRQTILIDGTVSLDQIDPALARELRRLAPFGNGNPRPTFVTRDLRMVRQRKFGRRGDHLQFVVEDRAGNRQTANWWRAGLNDLSSGRFNLAWNLSFNRLRGAQEEGPALLLDVVDFESVEETIAVTSGTGDGRPAREVFDLRFDPNPEMRLDEIRSDHPEAAVWCEGEAGIDGLPRNELSPSATLIIWTTPPGPTELERVLERVRPQQVFIFNQSPPTFTMEQFLRQLGSRLKFVISSRQGRTSLGELAGSLARRELEIRYGLEWFAAKGQIAFDLRRNGVITVSPTTGNGQVAQPRLEALLLASLEETAAYRRAAPLIESASTAPVDPEDSD